MRMSCNGCRALRKGCSKDCTLGPSLQWIKSPQSQANATLFLAKFYGRAGLINLINAGPSHLRHEILRSLLYEACGRIINPIYGSVGLVCSGSWPKCQAAVEAVLEGSPVVMKRISGDDHDDSPIIPLQGCDIRHLSKDQSPAGLHRIRSRQRFKRSSSKSKFDPVGSGLLSESDAKFTITGWNYDDEDQKEFSQGILNRGPSQDSLSADTLESVLLNRVEQPVQEEIKRSSEIGLELTLGLNPVVQQAYMSTVIEISDSD